MGLGTAGVLTAVSMGASLAGSGVSIAQAAKQNQLAKQAAADAEKAMAEAKKELDKNYYAQLGIAKEPYALQRQALLSSGAQAMLAGAESQRGAAATAGRVLMAQNEAQQGVTSSMAQDVYGLNKLVAGEDARLAGERSKIDLEQAKGAQMARHAAIVARNQAIAGAIGGLQGAANTGLDQYNKMYVNDKVANPAAAVTTAPIAMPSGKFDSAAVYARDLANPDMSTGIDQGLAGAYKFDSAAAYAKDLANPEVITPIPTPPPYQFDSAAAYARDLANPDMSTSIAQNRYAVDSAKYLANDMANPDMSTGIDMPYAMYNNPPIYNNNQLPSSVAFPASGINPLMVSYPNNAAFGYGMPWVPTNANWIYDQNYSDNSGLSGMQNTTSYYDPNLMGYTPSF